MPRDPSARPSEAIAAATMSTQSTCVVTKTLAMGARAIDVAAGLPAGMLRDATPLSCHTMR